MSKQKWINFWICCLLAAVVLTSATLGDAAVSLAPVPVSPIGTTVAVPTFSWKWATGAAYYKVEVGPQSSPLTVYWSDTTYAQQITPNAANPFPNEALYWRVAGYDSSDTPGPWSAKINFTKALPAPTLVSPAHASSLVEPVLIWQAVEGAAYYKVDLSTSATFVTLDHTYNTYNLSISPSQAIAHNTTWYWRVSGVDAADHVGTASAVRTFIKTIPAPTLVSPVNTAVLVEPVLSWLAVEGAAYYKVDLSTSATFVTLNHSYTTYNLSLTPAQTIAHSTTWYWRVSGVDAGDHVGTASTTRTFSKRIPPPTLVGPANAAVLVEPVLSWQALEGAAYYKVDLSTSASFVPLDHTYDTYNLSLTPAQAIDHGSTWYWRVSGVDAGDHVGTASAARTFSKTIPAPNLISPVNAGLMIVPELAWQAAEGAAYYQVELSLFDTFVPVAYTYNTYNLQITPAGPVNNGFYYWRVSGVDAGDHVGTASAARTFTLETPSAPVDVAPILINPPDLSVLTSDPNFSWTRMVGAHDYVLKVSKAPDFSPLYDTVVTHYSSYTPHTGGGGDQTAYPNGIYYWKVEARNASGTVIGNSTARSFTKTMLFNLSGPADGVTITTGDPTFQWARLVGAHDFYLRVSKDPDFSPLYDYLSPDYLSFTPYTGSAGIQTAYTNGTYYWKVEARDHAGTVIVSSAARSFTKAMSLNLSGPADGATITTGDPTYQWARLVGAHDFYLRVSKEPDFSPLYDHLSLDYTAYTPYTGGAGIQTAYPNGTYYWKVEARDHAGIVIVTSAGRSFTKTMTLNLSGPAEGATITSGDPTFQWARLVGAHDFYLRVSKDPDFSPLYDHLPLDYPTYIPYTGSAGIQTAYHNGTYYWKVEARDHAGIVIVTSAARSFTKTLPLTLTSPANGKRVFPNPTFLWSPVVGAQDYYLRVSKNAGFSPSYDLVSTPYPLYSPYNGAGLQDIYQNGAYFWKVEARDHAGIVITTSEVWTFTNGAIKRYLPMSVKSP